VSNDLVAEIRRLLGLPAADDDDAQDGTSSSTDEQDVGPVAPLNGQRLLDGAAGALGAPAGSVTINAAGTPADALRRHIRQQQP